MPEAKRRPARRTRQRLPQEPEQNPFPDGDPRRPLWDQATDVVEERSERLSGLLHQVEPDVFERATPEERAGLEADLAVSNFDIGARLCVHIAADQRSKAVGFEALAKWKDKMLASYAAEGVAGEVLARIEWHLEGRADLWRAEVRKAVREQTMEPPSSVARPSPLAPRSLQPPARPANPRQYRSALRRHIRFVLTQNPEATTWEICRRLDGEDVACPHGGTWVESYRSGGSGRKNNIDSAVSKIRRDLKAARLR